MLPKRHLLLAAVLIVSALSLVACGGGSNDDEVRIEEAIETSATTNDPANCTTVETQTFNEQSSGESGKAAVSACEAEAEEPNNADSVEVSEVEVDGSKATAQAAITGGSFDGQTVVIALVEEDGDWKLDELTEFVNFDKSGIVQQFKTQLEGAEEIEPETATCIVEGIEGSSATELEEVVLSGDATPIEELAESCS